MPRFLSLVLFAFIGTAMLTAAERPHPRLLIGPDEIPALRAKITKEPFQSMYQKLLKDVENNNWGYTPANPADVVWDGVTIAHRQGFLYVLTGDDAWAKKARGHVEAAIGSKKWASSREKGLNLYYMATYVSLAYDWCATAPSWDEAFHKTVSAKLLQMANVIANSGGSEQNTRPSSNWQALRRSSAGLAYLASDEALDEGKLQKCYDGVARFLRENLGGGDQNSGWNGEGLGYTYYPMGNGVCPFAIAMVRHDAKKDLRRTNFATPYNLWTCYAPLVRSSISDNGTLRPDFGDDNPGTNAEGCYGFAFWMCPADLHPGLKHWYDRAVGLLGGNNFDCSRFGTVASILFYPADMAEADPMTIPSWTDRFIDQGNGLMTFRNRYRDDTDVVIQLFAKLRGNVGHSGPDSLSFRIYGMDTPWAVGGGRYGRKNKATGQHVYLSSQNTVYPVDPDTKLTLNEDKGAIVGTPSSAADGGEVTMSAGQNNVGTTNLVRRLGVDFTQATGAEAAIVVIDSSTDGRFWQFCTLESNAITVVGNAFTVTNHRGDTLVGTILHPATEPKLTVGERQRGSGVGKLEKNRFVHAQSSDGHFVVAMTIQRKGVQAPKVSASGAWTGAIAGTVQVGGITFTVTDKTITTK